MFFGMMRLATMESKPREAKNSKPLTDIHSTIDPLPFLPNLARTLHGPTLSLVLTYLEIHHPAPESESGPYSSLSSAPIMLDCDQACADLGISNRTLHIALNCLG